MMHKTKIDYATHTWNPVWGCRRGCPYCYAMATAQRWHPNDGFEPRWMENNFNRSMPREPGARIFVNSMSDIEWWEPEWWQRVMARVDEYPQHTFLFLTKNPLVYFDQFALMNCWFGITATTEAEIMEAQKAFPSGNRFLSIEPILEAIDPEIIEPEMVDWVILGAETGNRTGRIVPIEGWIAPWLDIQIPLFMKDNLPWDGPRRREYPARRI